MTQYHGIYCPRCHRRYVFHLCREAMPCLHRDYLIECYGWEAGDRWREFRLSRVKYRVDEEGRSCLIVCDVFTASDIGDDELKKMFLAFLHKIPVYEWHAWVEAFQSLYFRTASSRTVPAWRSRQISILR